MLELRPNCEWCDCELPPNAPNAMICSYECTYCADCVRDVLRDVCPTCGGNFAPRPIRPVASWRPHLALGLQHHPAATQRKYSPWTPNEVAAFSEGLFAVPPTDR